MKRVFSLFLTLVMVVGVFTSVPVTVKAASADDLTFELNEDGESYSVTGCDSSASGEIVIPDTYNDLPVTSIGDYAFFDCMNLLTITIPDSVVTINYSAFEDCRNLVSVQIGKSIKSIENDVFADCYALTDVYYAGTIDEWIEIDAGNNSDSYFDYLRIHYSVYDSSAHWTENDAELNCTGNLLYNCSCGHEYAVSIQTGTGHNFVDGICSVCEKSALTFTINDECTEYTVTNCDESVGSRIIIPETYKGLPVTSIGSEAFSWCFGIDSVVITDNITHIDEWAFGNCENLSEVYYSGTEDQWNEIRIASGNGFITGARMHFSVYDVTTHWIEDVSELICTGCINYSCSCGYKYSVCTQDGVGHNFINNVCSICRSNSLTFRLNENGTEYIVAECDENVSGNIIIPSTYDGLPVTMIDNDCFRGCTSLKGLTIPDSIKEISANNFIGCTELKDIIISNETVVVNNRTYGAYEKLLDDTQYFKDTANWENGVLYLGSNLIAAKTDITGTYQIKQGTKTIMDYAFALCESLKGVVIPNGVLSIGERAFCDCVLINEIVIPESVTEIEEYGVGFYSGDMNPHTAYDGKVDIAYKVDDFKIYGVKSSSAETYATENGFTFIDLENHTHTSSDWIIDKKATANSAGSKHKECTVCGEVLEMATIPQLKPATPKLTSVTNSAKGVTVKWGAVEGADNYNVYRKTYNATTKKWSGWSRIKKGTTSTSYTDTTAKSGTYYRYTVIANNEAGSSKYDTTGLKIYFLSTPKLTSIANNTGKVTVKWGKVSGATGYFVYRRTYNATTKTWGGWTRIAKTKSNAYNDTSAKSGVYYRYTVRAYYGSYTSYFNTTGLQTKFLATPTLKAATSTKAGVKVTWSKVSGAKGYDVYRRTYSGGKWGGWSKIATTKSGSTVAVTDKTAKKGVTYRYTVRAKSDSYRSYYNTKGLQIKDKY